MVLTVADVRLAVARYAGRLHRVVGEGHHVASPLGAWLLLALCGPASSGPARAELADVLGCEVTQAAAQAGALLSAPHPLVAAAAALWRRMDTEALRAWIDGLPESVEAGRLTGGAAADQAALDEWARRHTFGLIGRLPADLADDVLLVLATALATKVSWETPFDVAPAAALGPGSRWASRLTRVLRTPDSGRRGFPGSPGHDQFIAVTEEAGDVAVHTARARDGLLVTSVAAQPGVSAADVIAAAYTLAGATAAGEEVPRRSLFDLPLGAAPLWEVAERHEPTAAPGGREERYTAVLPAWSTESDHDLARDPGLGFSAAGAALARLLGPGELKFQARQAAMARYSRTGFEAAAVTAVAVAASAMIIRPGVVRAAELRFGHPFAAVAVTADDGAGGRGRSPWHGLPVFSAWITEPEDAEEQAREMV